MYSQNQILIVVLTLFVSLCNAQQNINKLDNNGNRHGIWQKNYPKTNQLRYQGQFLHGKEIDTFKYYKLKRNKSVLSAVKVFNPNNDTAEVVFLTSKGKVVSKGKMDGRNFIGKWVYYHNKTDDIMIEENYSSNGLLSGVRNVYFANNQLAEVVEYDNGKKNGILKTYTESGKLLQQSIYKDDKLNGKTTYYDVNEQIRAQGHFKENLKTGIWLYYKNGKLTRKVDHDSDKVLYKKQ